MLLILILLPASSFSQQSTTAQSEPIASLGSLERQLKIALEQQKHSTALQLLDGIFAESRKCSLERVIQYQEVVTETGAKGRIADATIRYMKCLSATDQSSIEADLLNKEALFLKELLDQKQSEEIEEAMMHSPGKLADLIRRYWLILDPTPGTVSNERLLEHRHRIVQARNRFPSDRSETGLDDRGLIFLRYGEPDLIYDRPITITRGDLYSFLSDFQFHISGQTPLTVSTGIDGGDSNTEAGGEESGGIARTRSSASNSIQSQTSAYTMVSRMEEIMAYNPFTSSLNIWIYRDNGPEPGESLIHYFTQTGNEGFIQIESLEEWIPNKFYSPTLTAGSIPPALAIQYISYQRIMDLDPKFMKIYSDLNEQIFNAPVERNSTQIAHLARNNRQKRSDDSFLIQANSPVQSTSDGESIVNIPMKITQYRLLDESLKPVLTTFIQSDADNAFLNDYLRLKGNLFVAGISDEEAISQMMEWYRFEQGVELYDRNMQMLGRIRGYPTLEVDTKGNTPTLMLIDIPVPQPDLQQIFYAKFENRHPKSIMDSTLFFPDDLRGVGKSVVEPPEHFYEPESNELWVSDLIIGYQRIDDEIARFPFVVSHDRTIPENENLVVHFEAYNLHSVESSISKFEVQYRFEPKKPRRGWFGKRKSVPEGTLEFSTYDRQFRESLEFENLSLEAGEYTLTWTVRQPDSNRSVTRRLDLEIVEQ